jgi:hypothetical protein
MSKSALHFAPQSMPPGVLTTLPFPVVATETAKVPTSTLTPAVAVAPRPSLTV